MQHQALIGTVVLAHLLAVISPGPDFLVVVRNSLAYSRKTGIWTAIGIGSGITVHMLYSLAGLALLISKSILVFNAIKLAGAAYLIYVGIRSLLAKSGALEVGDQGKRADISAAAAFRMGFLTNVLNPKATLFFLSLFTMVIAPDTPNPLLVLLGLILIVNTALWFCLVAVFMSRQGVRGAFGRFQGAFNKGLGGLLVALGVKVALTQR